MTEIVVGAVYQHYRGGLYRVIAIATHSETKEPLVVYRDASDYSKVWARPLAMFNDTLSNGRKRFESS